MQPDPLSRREKPALYMLLLLDVDIAMTATPTLNYTVTNEVVNYLTSFKTP